MFALERPCQVCGKVQCNGKTMGDGAYMECPIFLRSRTGINDSIGGEEVWHRLRGMGAIDSHMSLQYLAEETITRAKRKRSLDWSRIEGLEQMDVISQEWKVLGVEFLSYLYQRLLPAGAVTKEQAMFLASDDLAKYPTLLAALQQRLNNPQHHGTFPPPPFYQQHHQPIAVATAPIVMAMPPSTPFASTFASSVSSPFSTTTTRITTTSTTTNRKTTPAATPPKVVSSQSSSSTTTTASSTAASQTEYHTYKGKKYAVWTGPRGGKFIKVQGQEIPVRKQR